MSRQIGCVDENEPGHTFVLVSVTLQVQFLQAAEAAAEKAGQTGGQDGKADVCR